MNGSQHRGRIKTESHYGGNWGEAHSTDEWGHGHSQSHARGPIRMLPADTDYRGMYEARESAWRNSTDITSSHSAFDYYSSVATHRCPEGPVSDPNEIQSLLQGWQDLYYDPHKANPSVSSQMDCDSSFRGTAHCARCSALGPSKQTLLCLSLPLSSHERAVWQAFPWAAAAVTRSPP